MPTNITIKSIDAPVTVVLEDGTTATIPAQTEKSFQLTQEGSCTILEGKTPEDDPSLPERAADALRRAMNKLMDRVHGGVGEPGATPHK